MYIVYMTTTHFTTVAQGRQHLRQLLDAAEQGLPNSLQRNNLNAVVVDADRFRTTLAAARPAHAEVVSEQDGWSIMLPGLPLAADGDTFDSALDDLVEALRDYAEDWVTHLRNAPNHRQNWDLVQLVDLATDAQLKEWITT